MPFQFWEDDLSEKTNIVSELNGICIIKFCFRFTPKDNNVFSLVVSAPNPNLAKQYSQALLGVLKTSRLAFNSRRVYCYNSVNSKLIYNNNNIYLTLILTHPALFHNIFHLHKIRTLTTHILYKCFLKTFS